MIKPWLFESVPELGTPNIEPNPDHVAKLFARYFDLWVRDETLGFEGIFFSEHHFGRSYSPSPNLLIAALAPRTTRLRLGVMGLVPAYYHPVRVIEEIGMLDHITGGRLEIGTAIGVRQELARLNITMHEARERNEEVLTVIDAALADRVVSYRGKYFSFDNLRPLPRTLQKPISPAMDDRRQRRLRASRRSAPHQHQHGFHAGPEYFALRRRVTLAATLDQAVLYAQGVEDRLKSFVAEDERLTAHVPDAPAGGFELSQDEFITGTPKEVARTIIEQCTAVGAGHFLTVLNWSAPIDEVVQAHELFGSEAIPLLPTASVSA